MYWGQQDASVTFCEDKYVVSDYIAEYYNTITAIFYVFISLIFFSKSKILSLTILGIGIGTALLHGTLRYYGQWVDEVSMLILNFYMMYNLNLRIFNIRTSIFILFIMLRIYFLFSHCYLSFLILFIGGQLYLLFMVKRELKKNKKKYNFLFYFNLIIILLACTCWICDQVICKNVKSYYLHAWWHILTSIFILTGIIYTLG